MADRYFVESPITGDRAVVTDSEAHHLLHVMRAKPGMEVVLFDGEGAEFPARVEKLSRSSVELAILSRDEVDRELACTITLGVALPKGDRQKWLVEKVVELGVGRLVPLVTTRGVAQPVAQALARLERAVIEASKQCGRNRLMEIVEPRAWEDYVQEADPSASRLIAHPGEAARLSTLPISGNVYLAVGPEGGFTDDEVALARNAGWQAVDLGRRIVRVETAAAMLASWVALKSQS